MTYSALAARFVAAPDNWPRDGAPVMAIAIHMAEGGGTVSWLTRDDGNSSHYVVEYDGAIVAMVHEERAAGSMNPQATRTADDAAYTYLGESIQYGATALKRCLGEYARDPNRVVVAIEVEGHAADGPNAKQRASLARLIPDIRKRRGPLPVIGHRDQQSYKACPGKKIPWVDYGGHAVIPAEEEPMIDTAVLSLPIGTTTPKGSGHYAFDLARKFVGPLDPTKTLAVYATVRLAEPINTDAAGDRQTAYLVQLDGKALYVLAMDCNPLKSAVVSVAEYNGAAEAERKRIADKRGAAERDAILST